MADGLGPAEPASASFIPPLGMNEELPLELRRCTRDLRVVALAAASINPRGDPIAVRVQLRHERMSQVVIAEGDTGAGGASSAGDGGYGGYGIGPGRRQWVRSSGCHLRGRDVHPSSAQRAAHVRDCGGSPRRAACGAADDRAAREQQQLEQRQRTWRTSFSSRHERAHDDGERRPRAKGRWRPAAADARGRPRRRAGYLEYADARGARSALVQREASGRRC